ncbi:MAG: glycerate kinase [Oscillospiraceae bacterium]|nr:glycerate kinase [Oscillospiraceae bacterium]
MKIAIAMDSFKGSLSSIDAGNAAAAGILRAFPEAEIKVFPVADGGEGTVDALVSGLNGSYRTVTVSDPLGRPIQAQYGILPDQTAVIEMAVASGLPLLSESERNPMKTTTYGFGEMIADAVRQGCRSFILGIGGSATNDCGIGCLQALGFGFYNKDRKQVPYGAKGLAQVHHITTDQVIPELHECQFHVASDVTNPLCGETGCSAVFAPQKGADSAMIAEMEKSMQRFSAMVKEYYPDSDADLPGSGAAGGLGFALRTFLNADLKPGIDVVINQTGIEAAISSADIVITGEGRMDAQTVMGKVPVGIAKIAKKYGLPVIAFCGCIDDGAEICNQNGIDAFFSILRSITTFEEAMKSENTKKNLADTAEQVFRLYQRMR